MTNKECNLLLLIATLLVASKRALSFTHVASIRRDLSIFPSLRMGILDEIFSQTSTPKVSAPKGFVPPEPRPLTVTETTDVGKLLKSSAALAVRLATGAFVLGWKVDTIFAPEDGQYALALGPLRIRDSSSVLQDAKRPAKPLILYEYVASPFCKRVRETINLLDLNVEIRPCPGARAGFAEQLMKRTGRMTVPYLVDPNTGIEMFESGDQIEYLLSTYGPSSDKFDRKALWPITLESFSVGTSTIAAILQDMPGSRAQSNARPDNTQMIPLELWGYECSPFVAPVREKLCSLCLPHIFVSCSRGSSNRNEMIKKVNRFQVPFLVDPNTGIEMFEGAEIVKYLDEVYTVK
jgi:glutathione S-transferase